MQGPPVSGASGSSAAGATDFGATGMGGCGVSGGRKSKEHEALEEQVVELKREVERMGRENEKLRGVVGRYRERWEKLKEGARVRREGTGDGGG